MENISSFILSILIPIFSKQSSIDINKLSGYFDNNQKTAFFNGRQIKIPEKDNNLTALNVLGASDSEKHIEVDLTNQKLIAVENNNTMMEFPISTGLWGWTPTGTFTTWVKLKYTLMSGGSKALGTYYFLPNVPYTMYFYNEETPKSLGYGIHGAYWHNNFGHPMSHGCINLKPEDAKTLFYWANPPISEKEWGKYINTENPGTKIIIYGTAPTS